MSCPPLRHPDRRSAALLLLAVALAVAVYHPILANYFYADDFVLFYDLLNGRRPVEFVLTPYGGHMYLTRNIVLLATYSLFGTDPVPYFWTVLITHAVNTALLFAVIAALTRSAPLAFLGAAFWGTSPLNEGTIGWYNIFGQVLAGTVLLGILWLVVRPAAAGRPLSGRTLAGCYVLAVIGSACFGTGLAIALVAPWVIGLLVPDLTRRQRWLLRSLIIVVPVLYVAVRLAHASISTRPTPGLSLGVMLLQAPKAIFLLFHLVAYGLGHLVLGFACIPRRCALGGGGAALMFFLALGAVVAYRRASPTARRQLLAVGLLTLAVYASIALARAPLQALFRAPTLAAVAAVPRYHYVGPLCLAILVCVVLRELAARPWLRRVGRPLLAIWAGLALLAYKESRWTVNHYASVRTETARVLESVRDAARAAPPGTTVYIPNRTFNSVGGLFARLPALFPGWAGVFVIFFPDDQVEGRRIRFVEADREALEKLTADPARRTATLLVPESASAGSQPR